MTPKELSAIFDERVREVQTYLALLQQLDGAVSAGTPKFEGASVAISPEQQKILYSTTYLQLYNLVESTVSSCMCAVQDAVTESGRWRVDDLTRELRREWVRAKGRTHVDLSSDNRLERSLELCDHIVSRIPVSDLIFELGGGGNWDDDGIEKASGRLGCALTISEQTRTAVKRHRVGTKGALWLVRNNRNVLAHGSRSFVECADGVSLTDLADLVDTVGAYLSEVVASFGEFIDKLQFVNPDRRGQEPA